MGGLDYAHLTTFDLVKLELGWSLAKDSVARGQSNFRWFVSSAEVNNN